MAEILVKVRVTPRAKRARVELAGDLSLRVYVTAAPERGKANEAVISLLAKRLGIAKRQIQIERGHRTRDKVILIEGMESKELAERLG